MGEKQNQPFQLSFNALKVDFQRSHIDPRGTNPGLALADLLRQSVYSRLAGYGGVNDTEGLSQNPTFRLIGPEKICPQQGRGHCGRRASPRQRCR